MDDHPVLRRGLAALIASEPDLVVSGEVATTEAALRAINEQPPDLAIIDLVLAESDGLSLIKTMKRHEQQWIPVLVLSMHDEAVFAERALRAGASGYVTKQQLDDTVLLAIRKVLDGGTYLSETLEASLAAKYIAGGTLGTDSPLAALSDRELQVFRLIG